MVGNRVHAAQGVGNVAERGDRRCFSSAWSPQSRPDRYRRYPSTRAADQLRAGLGSQHLPGHDVRVVFELGDQNPVARREGRFLSVARQQVDAGRGAGGEDDLLPVGRVQEAPGAVSGPFVGCGWLRRPGRVPRGARWRSRCGSTRPSLCSTASWLLGRGRVVQVDERLAVHRPRAEWGSRVRFMRCVCPARRAATCSAASSASGPSMHSLMKARHSMRLASARRQPTGAQVEEAVLRDLTDGGAVGAAHVVGVDLELGLGVDDRLPGAAPDSDWKRALRR